jgi:hypothetical protein
MRTTVTGHSRPANCTAKAMKQAVTRATEQQSDGQRLMAQHEEHTEGGRRADGHIPGRPAAGEEHGRDADRTLPFAELPPFLASGSRPRG